MADSTRVRGEQVKCHECFNIWPREHGGLQCPRCESEFVEILSDSNPPSPDLPPQDDYVDDDVRLTRSRSFDSLQHHHPWQNAPDPDEDDIGGFQFGRGQPQPRAYHWETRSPNGGSSFSLSMVSTNGGPMRIISNRGQGGGEFGDPAMAEVQNDFQDLIQTIMGVRQQRPMQNRGMMHSGQLPPGFLLATGGQHQPPGQAGVPFMGLFGSILQGLGGGAGFQHMMDPANASHGDAVFTQEALDRIISQLMEQNQGSNAPGPAPEAAIRSLPKKKVEKDMLDDRGKAECSICMDSVELGDQVTVLPCTHWFHETCITAWLKEHDTCPHCRKGISTQPEANGSASRGSANESQGGGQPARPPRRRSSAAMPGRWQGSYGSSRSPFVVDETSPGPQDVRAARHRHYSRREAEEPQRCETQGRWSPRSTPSATSSSSARRHRSGSHRSPSNSNSGGFTGWVRSLGGGGV